LRGVRREGLGGKGSSLKIIQLWEGFDGAKAHKKSTAGKKYSP